jgi:hypothetical protein
MTNTSADFQVFGVRFVSNVHAHFSPDLGGGKVTGKSENRFRAIANDRVKSSKSNHVILDFSIRRL